LVANTREQEDATGSLEGWLASDADDSIIRQQAFSGPLIDQNKNWLHYQALVNEREYNYIKENKLYYLEGQEAFTRTETIEFPVNTDKDEGAIEIKLAWKKLTKDDDESRYLVRKLPVVTYRPPGAAKAERAQDRQGGPGGGGGDGEGGFGRHAHRDADRLSPQWIWATFEQIDNTRVDKRTVKPDHKVRNRR